MVPRVFDHVFCTFQFYIRRKKKILGFTCRGWNKTSRPYNEVAKKETSSCGPEELPNQNLNWLLHRGSHAIFSLVGPYILLFEILSNIRLSQVDIKQIFIELFEYWVISIWTKEISSPLPIVARNFQLLSEDFNQIVGQSKDKAYVKIIGMNQGNIFDRHFLARDSLHRKLQRHVLNSLFVVWSQLGAQLGWWGTRRKA